MKSELIKEIKDEVKVIYDVDVTEEVVSDFISWYFKRQKNPIFDTTEREDFMYYLEDLGIVKLKD
jgi:hypothetical protein